MGDDIAAVAERLRLVRGARGKFLRLWAIDRSMIDPLVDRLALDLGAIPDSQPPAEASANAETQTTVDFPHDSAAHPTPPPVDKP